MRLTLRTMLAYLDDILEPADRDDIAQKIADSPFAARLLERIRDCSRNPKLPAPKLMEQGMGLDPNTVAEYLDNTLAGERVPEFETVCLPPQDSANGPIESDVFLAEVAACHQILTMVLGHPAQIDPEMKRRMYAILDQPQEEQSEIDPDGSESLRLAPIEDGLSSGSLTDFEFKARRRKPEVPEYLRHATPRAKWKPILAASILVILLLGAITMTLGPLDHHHPLLGWMFSSRPAEQTQVAANTPTADQPPRIVDSSHPAAATPQPVPGPPPIIGQANQPPLVVQSPATAPTSPAAAPQNPSIANSVNAAGANTNSPANNPPIENRPAPAALLAPEPAPAMATPPATQPAPAPPIIGAARSSNPTASLPSEKMRPAPGADVPTPGDASVDNSTAPGKTPPPQPVASTEIKPVGRFLPAKDIVLLRYDDITQQWLSLPTATGAPLFGSDQLLVLPNYRPTLVLTSGISLQVPPETRLQLEPPDAAGVPGVKLFYGRLVVMTTGKSGAQLHMDFGVASGTVTFVDAEATLAVETHSVLPPGSNPETVEPVRTVDLYAANGQLQWTSTDGAIATLRASQHWTLPANPPDNGAVGASAQTNLPKWISPESLTPLDARCAEQLAADMESNKPLLLALREMADRPQVELHAFAAESLAYLGEFDTLVSALGDPDRKLKWQADLDTLQAALTRGPETAAKVRETFEKQRGDGPGKQLYRMLLGYTKEQLQNGEAAQLVDALDNDSLDYRVLAFTNLREITNKTHSYHPDVANAASRSQALKLWREDLRTGAIVPHEATAQK